MITTFGDPFDTLFNLQRALEGRLESDWLQDQTTSQGPFPPINVFQQGDDILAIIELPGVEKDYLQIQAKENTIRIAGKKRSPTRKRSAFTAESAHSVSLIGRYHCLSS